VTSCRYINTYGLGSPFAILDSEEVVCEAQIICKLLQKVNTEAGTTLVGASVPMRFRNVRSEILKHVKLIDRLCGLMVRVLGYRSRSPGSIPGTTTFFDK
jgi:hypothetical protein